MENHNTAESPSAFRRLQHTTPLKMLIGGFLYATKYLPLWFLRYAGIPFVIFFIILNYKNFIAIQKNLKNINSELSVFDLISSAFAVFKNYSFYLIDLFYISHDIQRIKKYRIKITGIENLEDAVNTGKGIILLTSHIGNWEVGGLVVASLGKEINIVYSPDSSILLESQRRLMRTAKGIREIALKPGGFSSIKLLRILSEGRIIALQGDRLLFDSGVTMPFFNKTAIFPKGAIKLGIITDSIIVPVFIPITGYKSYVIIIERPIAMEKDPNPELELKINLSKIVKVFEKYIALYSTQWFTFMPFWDKDKEG